MEFWNNAEIEYLHVPLEPSKEQELFELEHKFSNIGYKSSSSSTEDEELDDYHSREDEFKSLFKAKEFKVKLGRFIVEHLDVLEKDINFEKVQFFEHLWGNSEHEFCFNYDIFAILYDNRTTTFSISKHYEGCGGYDCDLYNCNNDLHVAAKRHNGYVLER